MEIPYEGGPMDPISNMLVSIKNAYMAKKDNLLVPYSKFKFAVAKVLEKEGYVGLVEKHKSGKIEINLVYQNQKPRLTEVKRISKLGLRVYTKSKNIKKVKGGLGITIISTPKGVMTGKIAKEKKLGGEVICQVW